MCSIRFLLFLLAFCVIAACEASSSARASISREVQSHGELKTMLRSEFSFQERLLLLLASKLKPEAFAGLPMQEYLFDVEQYLDAAFIDLRSLIFQARNWPADNTDTTSLPEIDYTFRPDLCNWFICIDWEITIKTGGTSITGIKDVTSKTELTPSSLRNSYAIPFGKWSSPGWVFNITDLTDLRQDLYRNSHVSLEGMNSLLEANYEFSPDLGLQISNLSIDFSLTSFVHYLDDYTVRFPNGSEARDGPFLFDNAETAMNDWEYYGPAYIQRLQFQINCVLSNGRVDPIECGKEGEYYDHVGYSKMNVFQLIQTLGLAALTRP